MTKSKNEKRNRVVLGLMASMGLLAFSSCACCIVWTKSREDARIRQDAVGSAARILELRAQLDRIADGFPAAPAHGACGEPPPPERVVVLSLDELRTFRAGDGVANSAAGSLDLTSTHIHGHDRPADGLSDDDAYRQLDALVSPLRAVGRTPWVAVVRTRDVRMPAVILDRFLPGSFEGDVVVFELATGRPICAQPLSATNRADVDVSTLETGAEAAQRDLATQLDAAKEQARQRLSPQLQLDW